MNEAETRAEYIDPAQLSLTHPKRIQPCLRRGQILLGLIEGRLPGLVHGCGLGGGLLVFDQFITRRLPTPPEELRHAV